MTTTASRRATAPASTTCAEAFARHAANEALAVPLPAAGRTWQRLWHLAQVARQDLSLARLVEGHLDALAILREANREPAPGARYGVWASGGPQASLCVEATDGGLVLRGSKPFCSGAGLVDRALLLVDADQSLVEVDLRAGCRHVQFDTAGWCADAFAATHTWTVHFDGLPLDASAVVGAPGWYFERPGFWHGALAPAACWAGGALALVSYTRDHAATDALARVHAGAMLTSAYAMTSTLQAAATAADGDPQDRAALAYPRAIATRQIVERACTATLDQFARFYGPRPLAFDPLISRRVQELSLYLRQHHAERDLADLGEHLARFRPDAGQL